MLGDTCTFYLQNDRKAKAQQYEAMMLSPRETSFLRKYEGALLGAAKAGSRKEVGLPQLHVQHTVRLSTYS